MTEAGHVISSFCKFNLEAATKKIRDVQVFFP
jgi:hypothetical protein